MKKSILDILRMTNHNGPGFRTLVLFKGCPMRCVWCSTPESQKAVPEIGIHKAKCKGEGNCIPYCKTGAISIVNEKAVIDRGLCNYCGACEKPCYNGAIKFYGHMMSVEETLEEILKDQVLMETSGGGVTFSGGEPLFLEPEFNKALFMACQENGINVGVQTCGHVPWDHIETILPYVNFFLWDLKHMDNERHKELTGTPNELLLDNIKRVSERGVPLYIRVPVIPGHNDSEENIKETCRFVNGLKSVKAFDLLPIHHLGKARYECLGRPYLIDDVPLLTNERIDELKNQVESYGIMCGIGG